MSNSSFPVSSIDLFADEVLDTPYAQYTELRAAGAAVWMERFKMWALPRYAEVRSALMDWKTFSSKDAVCVGEEHNALYVGTVLASDPPLHDQLRAVLAPSLAPRALADMKSDLERRASDLVTGLVQRGEFDAVGDLAAQFPVSVVADLVGLPEEGRDRLLARADASFNTFGPVNDRSRESMWTFPESFAYIQSEAARAKLRPGSMGAAVYEAADRGEISPEQCLPLMLAYLFAGMDTTVNSIGSAVWLFATHPEQWRMLRKDPSLIPAAFEEVLRFESPVQAFARRLVRPYVADGITLNEGDRAIILYGSANRDERKFENPEAFNIRRGSSPHVAFGMGLHLCAGQGLARLEGQAVLAALARTVERFELVEVHRHLNNAVRGLGKLRVKVH